LFYTNYLPKNTTNKYKTVIFADYTSIIVTNSNLLVFTNEMNKIFKEINDWFNAKLLSLNTDKI
jgi:hypothetical protein